VVFFFDQVDLDLGNYERFLDVTLTKDNNITTGKIYQVARCLCTLFLSSNLQLLINTSTLLESCCLLVVVVVSLQSVIEREQRGDYLIGCWYLCSQ